MRATKQKMAILDFLRSKRAHYNAVQIHEAVQKQIPTISLSTIYRNLAQLIETGEIASVEASDKCVFYDGYVDEHSHFVCERCKKIYDFPVAKAISEPERAGFTVKNQRVVYYGLCSECSNTKGTKQAFLSLTGIN